MPQKTFDDFRRLLVARGEERCIVDLVVDRAPVVEVEKPLRGTIRVDSLREIAANKICTLLGRSELKDLVDLRELLRSGCALEQMLEDAGHKDASVDPATLAWLLSQLKVKTGSRLPEGVDPNQLDEFRLELIGKLEDLAFERARRPRET